MGWANTEGPPAVKRARKAALKAAARACVARIVAGEIPDHLRQPSTGRQDSRPLTPERKVVQAPPEQPTRALIPPRSTPLVPRDREQYADNAPLVWVRGAPAPFSTHSPAPAQEAWPEPSTPTAAAPTSAPTASPATAANVSASTPAPASTPSSSSRPTPPRCCAANCAVGTSPGSLDDRVWRAFEPDAAPPRARLETVTAVRRAGVSAGVRHAHEPSRPYLVPHPPGHRPHPRPRRTQRPLAPGAVHPQHRNPHGRSHPLLCPELLTGNDPAVRKDASRAPRPRSRRAGPRPP